MSNRRSDPLAGTEATNRHRALLGAALIFALTLIVYIPAMRAGFIWDDETYVERNTLLQLGWEGLERIWTPRETPQYYPVVFTMFWLEHQVWGYAPQGYHVVNVILHALNALLVWRLASVLRIRWAWLIGAVFALHPVHVESVAWITERKNTLSGFFYLLAAIAYLRFDHDEQREEASGNRWLFYAVSFVLFVLALLSKSVTCSLPAALILMMLWERKRITFQRLAPLIPFFVIGLLLALNTARIEHEHVGATGEEFAFSIADRFLIASKALLFYPWKILWPWPVIFIYPRWVIDDGNVWQYWSVAIVIVIAVVATILFIRGTRGPGLALAFFAGTIFPALGFVNVYPMVFSFVADHFQYLASLGIIALAVSALALALQTRQRMALASILILTPLALITFVHSMTFANRETLYRATLSKNDNAFMAHNNLATELLRQSEYAEMEGRFADRDALHAEAHQHLLRAIELKPRYAEALGNLSDFLAIYGRYEEALQFAQQSLDAKIARADIQEMMRSDVRPKFSPISDAFRSVATLQATTNRREEAKRSFEEAIGWDPDDLGLRGEYAELLVKTNDLDGARAQYERVLQIDPTNVGALGTLAEIARRQERFAEARHLYQRAIDAAPFGPERERWQLLLIRLLATCPDPKVRDTALAIRLADQIVQNTGRRNPAALDVLANVLAEDGRISEAIATGEEAANLADKLRMADLAKDIRARVEQYRAKAAGTG
jgi:tetratricopeptide (TPR) repeat protein